MTCASFDEVLGRNHEATAAFMRRDTQPFKTSFRGRTTPPLQTRSAASHVASVRSRPGSIGRRPTTQMVRSSGPRPSRRIIGRPRYLLEIEHLRGRVGSRDVVDDVSLRVTSVFRCEDGEWRLVHRHADPASELRAPETIV